MNNRTTRRQIIINRWFQNNMRAAKAAEREVKQSDGYKAFERTYYKRQNNE